MIWSLSHRKLGVATEQNAVPRHWGCRDEQDTVVLRIHSLNEEMGQKKKDVNKSNPIS